MEQHSSYFYLQPTVTLRRLQHDKSRLSTFCREEGLRFGTFPSKFLLEIKVYVISCEIWDSYSGKFAVREARLHMVKPTRKYFISRHLIR